MRSDSSTRSCQPSADRRSSAASRPSGWQSGDSGGSRDAIRSSAGSHGEASAGQRAISVLRVRNRSGRARRLSLTGYVEWVLGDLRAKSALHVATEIAPQSGALYARNVYNSEFAALVAFFDVDDSTRKLTADRGEFLGRNGRASYPERPWEDIEPVLRRMWEFDGRLRAWHDVRAAVQAAWGEAAILILAFDCLICGFRS